jgi:hypothetical protein
MRRSVCEVCAAAGLRMFCSLGARRIVPPALPPLPHVRLDAANVRKEEAQEAWEHAWGGEHSMMRCAKLVVVVLLLDADTCFHPMLVPFCSGLCILVTRASLSISLSAPSPSTPPAASTSQPVRKAI